MSQDKNSKRDSDVCSDDDERMSESSDENGQAGLELEDFNGRMHPFSNYETEEFLRWQQREAKINQRLIELDRELHHAGRVYIEVWEVYRRSQPAVQGMLLQIMRDHNAKMNQLQLEQKDLKDFKGRQNGTHTLYPQSASSSSSSSFSSSSFSSSFSSSPTPVPTVTTTTSTPTSIPSFTYSPRSRSESPDGSLLVHSPSRNELRLPEFSTASTESMGSRSATPQHSDHLDRRRSISMTSSPSSRGSSPTKPE